jgi:hypothetical protein
VIHPIPVNGLVRPVHQLWDYRYNAFTSKLRWYKLCLSVLLVSKTM